MNDEVKKLPEESIPTPSPVEENDIWTAHHVVHVELVSPIQAGGHKRSYLRYNLVHDQSDITNGVMTLPRIGDTITRVPVVNIVCWHMTWVFVPDYNDTGDWKYKPIDGFIQVDDPIGYYYRENDFRGGETLGWLYENGDITRDPNP